MGAVVSEAVIWEAQACEPAFVVSEVEASMAVVWRGVAWSAGRYCSRKRSFADLAFADPQGDDHPAHLALGRTHLFPYL